MHPSTVARWALRGLRGRRLRSVRIGATLCTTATWLSEFIAEISPKSTKIEEISINRTAIDAKLAAKGLLPHSTEKRTPRVAKIATPKKLN
ncbi:hypothetical protein ETAA8_58370 [Anatilimnocola aggregata]|uniref:Uncharacterized protein n=1 Tax=Anatilimnocola aggregata TaxID=2528021 RepID=A0A517YKF0_9BACT|nr:hypothetical protein ETAA8_58370 [Anatilimnocola aggregata]